MKQQSDRYSENKIVFGLFELCVQVITALLHCDKKGQIIVWDAHQK